jgi:hypothetical protein
MLFWINKPNQQSTREIGVGPKKFFCGRKKKYGITLQGIRDHNRKFLDIEMGHPGSTSDYLGFTTSEIHKLLLMNIDFLAPNLTFFGDNAYINTEFVWQLLTRGLNRAAKMLTTSFTHNFVSTLNVPLACLSIDGVFCASHFLSTLLFGIAKRLHQL